MLLLGEASGGTTSSSGSRVTWSCSVRAPWRGSTSAWNPSWNGWWTPALRPPLQRGNERSPHPVRL